MISDFRRDVEEICALLGCYAAYSGSSLPTIRDNLSVPPSRASLKVGPNTLEVGADRLFRIIGKELPQHASKKKKNPEKSRYQFNSCLLGPVFQCPLCSQTSFNPSNHELNPICYLLALLGAHHFLHVSRIRVKLLTFRRLMSYIWSTHS